MKEISRKEELKALLVRLWFNGLVCFMVLWGTGISQYMLDLLVFLPLAHFIADLVFETPMIKGMFHTRADIEKKYSEMTSFQRIKRFLYTFFENFIIVLIVMGIYQGINTLAYNLGYPKGKVFLAVEPILYGVIFTFVYYFFYFIKYGFMINLIQGRREINEI